VQVGALQLPSFREGKFEPAAAELLGMAQALVAGLGQFEYFFDAFLVFSLQQLFHLPERGAGRKLIAAPVVPEAGTAHGYVQRPVAAPHHQSLRAIAHQHSGVGAPQRELPAQRAGVAGARFRPMGRVFRRGRLRQGEQGYEEQEQRETFGETHARSGGKMG
jgi:hypothetical protein